MISAVPFERDFTLIGTTDVDWIGSLADVAIDPAEVDYICQPLNRWSVTPTSRRDVVRSYAGLRPLFDDAATKASEISRDYVLSLNDDMPPILSVFGGKIITYRVLAADAVNKVAGFFSKLGPDWTAGQLFRVENWVKARLKGWSAISCAELLLWITIRRCASPNLTGQKFGTY